MAAGCCHPVLAWILNLLLTILSIFISLLVVFTTVSGRPKHFGDQYRPEVILTTHEELLLSHAAFLIISVVFLQKIQSVISCGDHRDEKFRIEKAFIILAVIAILLSLLNLILVVVVATMRDTMVDFIHETSLANRVHEFYFGSTTPKYTIEKRHENSMTMVFILVAIDSFCFLLSLVGTILVTGCTRREKYVFNSLLTKKQSRNRSYNTMAANQSHSIEEAVDV